MSSALIFFLCALAQEEAEETSAQTVFPVLHNGLEPERVLWRTQAASKRDTTVLKTMKDIRQNKDPVLTMQTESNGAWSSVDVYRCLGTPVSESKINHLIQSADNNLLYFELEKAAEQLKKAEESIPCLQERLNIDTIRRLFFLKGNLYYFQEKPLEARKAFDMAVRIQPNQDFGEDYSEEAEIIFAEAKKGYARSSGVPIQTSPYSAETAVWVNGIPSDPKDILYAGTNIIQVINDQVQTYVVSVPQEAKQLQMIVPMAVENSVTTWISNEDKHDALRLLLPHLLPMDTEYYIHDNGRVWTSTIGQTSWTELKVPLKYGPKEPFSKTVGRYMFWGGVATFVGSGISVFYNLVEGGKHQRDGLNADKQEAYAQSMELYEQSKDRYQVSLIVGAGGLVMGGVGYRLAF